MAFGLFGALMNSDAGVTRHVISGTMLVAPELVALERRIPTSTCHLQVVEAHRIELRFETVDYPDIDVDVGSRMTLRMSPDVTWDAASGELSLDEPPAPRASLPAAQICGSR